MCVCSCLSERLTEREGKRKGDHSRPPGNRRMWYIFAQKSRIMISQFTLFRPVLTPHTLTHTHTFRLNFLCHVYFLVMVPSPLIVPVRRPSAPLQKLMSWLKRCLKRSPGSYSLTDKTEADCRTCLLRELLNDQILMGLEGRLLMVSCYLTYWACLSSVLDGRIWQSCSINLDSGARFGTSLSK